MKAILYTHTNCLNTIYGPGDLFVCVFLCVNFCMYLIPGVCMNIYKIIIGLIENEKEQMSKSPSQREFCEHKEKNRPLLHVSMWQGCFLPLTLRDKHLSKL